MASCSLAPAAQKGRRMSNYKKEVQATGKATRHSDRIRAATEKRSKSRTHAEQQGQYPARQENFSNPEQTYSSTVKAKKRGRDSESHTSIERPSKRLQIQTASCTKQAKGEGHSEDKVYPPRAPPESSPLRPRTSTPPTRQTIGEARIDYWRKTGSWPTEEEKTTMNRLLELGGPSRRPSLSRKRSNASMTSETNETQTSSSHQNREQKSAPYQHSLFTEQLMACGSFMSASAEGVTAKSKELCQTLLKGKQPTPENTLFSDDALFDKTIARLEGENETKVIRDIALLIVPSAEILADRGATHLEILRETVNKCWVNSATFIQPPGLKPGPRPQPDFGLGFKSTAFSQAQAQKLRPFLGNLLTDSTLFAATYNMYLPFFSAEVKCGLVAIEIADRQNAHTQSVILRGLYTLFRMVGREKELHREINGFSISHSDTQVRIRGHYAVIDGDSVKYYRHPIHSFDITALDGENRWVAYTFVRNMYDLWVPGHFKRICAVIDMLPADLDFDVSEQDAGSTTSAPPPPPPPALESSGQGGGGGAPAAAGPTDSPSSAQPITPDTTSRAASAASTASKSKSEAAKKKQASKPRASKKKK